MKYLGLIAVTIGIGSLLFIAHSNHQAELRYEELGGFAEIITLRVYSPIAWIVLHLAQLTGFVCGVLGGMKNSHTSVSLFGAALCVINFILLYLWVV